jgi:SRSO17 transposase
VLEDAGYGNNSGLRAEMTALGLTYVAGILSNTTVWPRGTGPRPPPKQRCQTQPAAGRMVVDRMAQERERADQYWLSTLPENTTLQRLVYFAKLRWRIERDYQELKQEVGLGHFEGRGWRGFHHHATLCIGPTAS